MSNLAALIVVKNGTIVRDGTKAWMPLKWYNLLLYQRHVMYNLYVSRTPIRRKAGRMDVATRLSSGIWTIDKVLPHTSGISPERSILRGAIKAMVRELENTTPHPFSNTRRGWTLWVDVHCTKCTSTHSDLVLYIHIVQRTNIFLTKRDHIFEGGRAITTGTQSRSSGVSRGILPRS